MKEGIESNKLVFEEIKAVKLFLPLFYIIFLGYDFFYYYIFPKSTGKEPGILTGGLHYYYYILILCFIPIGIYLFKKGNPYAIKYIYFFGFNIIDVINLLLIYFGKNVPFQSGNMVDVFFVLFSPLFINKKYFWIASIGMIIKYVLLGTVLLQTRVLFPITLLIFISLIAFLLLGRFFSYVETLKSIFEDLRNKERLAVIGQMSTAIGHEIRNPLSSLRGFTQLQSKKYPEDSEYYSIMLQEIDRINTIVGDLMILGKPKSHDFQKVNIEEVIDYTLSVARRLAEDSLIEIKTKYDSGIQLIECDGNQMKQVFLNLVKNAIEAMPSGGSLDIEVQAYDKANIIISVIDTGIGITDENIKKLGEPFFTTKQLGTGLGLMVTKYIIKEHNGRLEIQSAKNKGSKFDIILPKKQ